MDMEKKGTMTNKQKINLKKEMYNDFYKKSLEKINSNIVRFDTDTRYKKLRNPDLETIMDKKEYKNVDVKKLLDQKVSLNKILEAYGIDKKEITSFQANFTPESDVQKLIEAVGIEKDTNTNIKIIEPTAGIGNIVSGLIRLKNASNFIIDANEYHKVFYNIGKATFDKIDNVVYHNMDYFKYEARYPYDYVIGNPPFNLRSTLDIYEKKSKTFEKIDFTFYDIHFVARAYNSLKTGGKLGMIISNRHTRDKNFPFNKFNQYLKLLGNKHQIIPLSGVFEEEEGVSKEMKVNFGMEIIILEKVDREIDLMTQEQVYFENDAAVEAYEEENPTKKRGGKKKLTDEEKEFLGEDVDEFAEKELKKLKKEKLFVLPKKEGEVKKLLKDVKEDAKKLGIKITGKNKKELEEAIKNFKPGEVKEVVKKTPVKKAPVKKAPVKKAPVKPAKEKPVKRLLKDVKQDAIKQNIILSYIKDGKRKNKTKKELEDEINKKVKPVKVETKEDMKKEIQREIKAGIQAPKQYRRSYVV
jgi:methylase of polypeptide subunit release factors